MMSRREEEKGLKEQQEGWGVGGTVGKLDRMVAPSLR